VNRQSSATLHDLLVLVLGVLTSMFTQGAWAQGEPFKVPVLSRPVMDEAQMLDPTVRQQLNQVLEGLWRQGGSQLVVLTIPELGGETIEQASIRVVDQWKLGDAQKDNGVLLMVAKTERKVRIEVGQGLEGELTDAYSKRIIDQAIVPLFKEGRFTEGIVMGAYRILEKTDPQFPFNQAFQGLEGMQPSRRGQSSGSLNGLQLIFVIIFVILAIFFNIISRVTGLGRSLRHHGHRRDGWGGGWGGGGGGFGGGGFGGGGGGFSGGGASGNW